MDTSKQKFISPKAAGAEKQRSEQSHKAAVKSLTYIFIDLFEIGYSASKFVDSENLRITCIQSARQNAVYSKFNSGFETARN